MITWRRASLCASGECVEVGVDWQTSTFSGAQNCVEVAGPFTKSSHSVGGDCVEAAGPFRKASASAHNGNCVEQAGCTCGVDVLVRDSKNPEGGVLEFSREAWAQFLADIKAGSYTHRP